MNEDQDEKPLQHVTARHRKPERFVKFVRLGGDMWIKAKVARGLRAMGEPELRERQANTQPSGMVTAAGEVFFQRFYLPAAANGYAVYHRPGKLYRLATYPLSALQVKS